MTVTRTILDGPSLRCGAVRILLLCASAALVFTSSAGARGTVEVLESDPSGVTLVFQLDSYSFVEIPHEGIEYKMVRAPGLVLSGEEGAPALPVKSALLAVPHGATVRVDLRSEDLQWLENAVPPPWPSERIEDNGDLPHAVADLRADDRHYTSGAVYPPSAVEVREVGTVRGHRVVSVLFWPFRYDAGRGGLEFRRRIVARVEFEGGQRRRPSPMRSGDRRWEPLLKGLLPNYEQGALWRRVRAPAGSFGHPRAGTGPEFKFKVRNSSLYRVLYDDLASLGLSSGASVEDLRLYEKSYSPSQQMTVETEIPILVEDLDADGTFGPGESFIFYGLSYWDRFPDKFGEGARVRPHVYWLAVEESSGSRMGSSEAWGDFIDPETPRSFTETLHLQEDKLLNRSPHDADVLLFWFHSMIKDESFPVEVPSPDAESPYGIRVRFQASSPTSHAFGLFMENGSGLVDTITVRGVFSSVSYMPSGKPPYTYMSGLSGKRAFLSGGANSLRIVGERFEDNRWVPGLGAFLDWFEIDYARRYVAWNDTITCSAEDSGAPLELRLGGFSSSDLLAFDVTDPLNPSVYNLESRNVSEAGDGTYTLVIRGEFPVKHRMAAVASGAVSVLDMENMELDTPSDLRGGGEGADYLVVVYDDFADEIGPLVDLRESQGFQVAVAKASDVYDEFGDGYKSSQAIKNYFTYAYNNWGSAYGLLVGDASEDTENLLKGPQGGATPPDFVPTRLHLHTGVPSAPGGPEIVNSDSWYGVWLDGDTADWVPDMFIGRLPVGSVKETRDVVDKLVRYESYGGADEWRSRGLLVADDSYSSTIFSNEGYCFKAPESSVFEPVCERISGDLEDAEDGVPGFAAPVFKLDDYLGAFPDDPKKQCYDGFELFDIQDFTRASVSPALVDTMSLGWLLVSYQGHGNEDVWAHESLFTSYPNLGGLDDVSLLGNTDRPFILFAFSCHVSDFDDRREGDAGDCMGERMVLLPDAGAIAAIASSGYEYLSTGWFNVPLVGALLVDPPVDGDAGEVHIRLGPAIAKGEIAYLGTASSLGRHALETFAVLGDPAMRIDAAPPRIAAAIGDSMFFDGDRIEDPSGADTLGIRFEIRDEVAVDSTSIFLREIWHRTEGQDSTFNVPSSEYRVSRSREGRSYNVDYTLDLLPASMEMIAGALDRNGRRSTITLQAVLSAVWEADGQPLSPNDFVGATSDLAVRLSSPIPVSGDVLSVAVDGGHSASFTKRRTDLVGMEWELFAPGFRLSDGEHTLSLLVDGRPVKTVNVRVDTRFRFVSMIPYPSPCDEKGTTFFYELTSTGSVEITEVVMKIYSVSGRLVTELRDSNPIIGRGSILWDAMDGHGEKVANGAYLCRTVAVGSEGNRASILSKVAVAR